MPAATCDMSRAIQTGCRGLDVTPVSFRPTPGGTGAANWPPGASLPCGARERPPGRSSWERGERWHKSVRAAPGEACEPVQMGRFRGRGVMHEPYQGQPTGNEPYQDQPPGIANWQSCLPTGKSGEPGLSLGSSVVALISLALVSIWKSDFPFGNLGCRCVLGRITRGRGACGGIRANRGCRRE